jgi:biotin carboxyl carrier protein
MKRFIRPVVFALLAALAPPLTLFAAEALRVDSCLDKGGSYDYQLRRCDFARMRGKTHSAAVYSLFASLALSNGVPDANRPGKTIDYCSRVKEGDVLAKLDDLPHQAELEKATANLRLTEAELKRNRSHHDQAERDFQRAEKLRDTNSEAEYENVVSQYEIAQAELAMSEAKVEQAKGVQKQAEINLNYTTIRSPVNGTVIDRRVNVGQTVVAGLNAPSLFLLAKDLSHMLVWAAVNEVLARQEALGLLVNGKFALVQAAFDSASA